MKTLILIGMVAFLLCMPYTFPYTFFPDRPNWSRLDWAIMVPMESVVEAGYLAGSHCGRQPVSRACPDRSFGWQEREYSGSLAPEAGSAGGAAGGASGDAGGSSGGTGGGAGPR